MNYQKVIKNTLHLQNKIIKACGREFGSLKSFNSKYYLGNIDYTKQIASFYKLHAQEEYLHYNFELVRKEGRRINHTIEVTLIK